MIEQKKDESQHIRAFLELNPTVEAGVEKSVHHLLNQHRKTQSDVPLKAACKWADDIFY
jgi:3-methyladenine DNA glycosylase AlkC